MPSVLKKAKTTRKTSANSVLKSARPDADGSYPYSQCERVPVTLSKATGIRLVFLVAYDPVKSEKRPWRAGYDHNGPIGLWGGGVAHPRASRPGYATRDEALADAVRDTREWITRAYSQNKDHRLSLAVKRLREFSKTLIVPAKPAAAAATAKLAVARSTARPSTLDPRPSTALVTINPQSSIPPPLSGPLSAAERKQLARCKAQVDNALGSLVVGCEALRTIRDERLYREQAATFEEFCEVELRVDRSMAYRWISVATVWQNIRPAADKLGCSPRTESQFRPLAKVPAEKQAEAWGRAIALAPKDADGRPEITARVIEQAAAEYTTNSRPTQAAVPVRSSPPDLPGEYSGPPAAGPASDAEPPLWWPSDSVPREDPTADSAGRGHARSVRPREWQSIFDELAAAVDQVDQAAAIFDVHATLRGTSLLLGLANKLHMTALNWQEGR